MKKCSKCKSDVWESARYCRCGYEFQEWDESDPSNYTRSKSKASNDSTYDWKQRDNETYSEYKFRNRM